MTRYFTDGEYFWKFEDKQLPQCRRKEETRWSKSVFRSASQIEKEKSVKPCDSAKAEYEVNLAKLSR